jgi:hypothetical protein
MFQPIGLPASRVVERIAAARNRHEARVRRAGAKVRQNGGSAADAAVAAIGAGFDRTAEIADLKIQCLHAIRHGAGSAYVRARYGARLRLIRERLDGWRRANQFAAQHFLFAPESSPEISLTIAIRMVEHWYSEERRALRIGAVLGYGNAHSLKVLEELRLLLRLLRRSEYHGHFSGLVAFAVGHALEAAE